MDRFLASADYEFECASIVGRKFEDVADHAQYVREGGCAKIISALAAREARRERPRRCSITPNRPHV